MIAYTHPDVLGTGVTAGWADPETDPTRIDWPVRQAAAIRFDVVDRRPVNPYAPTGIEHGRNELGHWGEARAADAIVTATTTDGRFILLVERGDGHGWALPGGGIEPGETADMTAVRELAEETGLRLRPGTDRFVLAARYVQDPRASDEAWTTPVTADLGHHDELPVVAGADDAVRAVWVHADSYDALLTHLHTLVAGLHEPYAGTVFPAHETLLREVLDGPGDTHPQNHIDDEPAHRTAAPTITLTTGRRHAGQRLRQLLDAAPRPYVWYGWVFLAVGLLVTVLIAVTLGRALLALTVFLADTSTSLGAWLTDGPITRTITTPVHTYLDQHAGVLPAASGLLFTTWLTVTAALWLTAVLGGRGARIGWTLLGALSTAMVHAGTAPPGQHLAAGLTVTVWAVLSIPALRRTDTGPTVIHQIRPDEPTAAPATSNDAS